MNLSTGEVKVEEYGEELAKKWLGSRGLAIYLLLKEMDPKADPLGPENKLIITPGPLTGTSAPPTGGADTTSLRRARRRAS